MTTKKTTVAEAYEANLYLASKGQLWMSNPVDHYVTNIDVIGQNFYMVTFSDHARIGVMGGRTLHFAPAIQADDSTPMGGGYADAAIVFDAYVDVAEFHYLSDWQTAVVAYEGKLAVVDEVDADDDATWILLVYGSTRFDQHWVTTDDVDYLYQPTLEVCAVCHHGMRVDRQPALLATGSASTLVTCETSDCTARNWTFDTRDLKQTNAEASAY